MANDTPKKITLWRVKAPGHNDAIVNAADSVAAGVEAARVWCAPWKEIAAYLEVSYEGEQYMRQCPKCGRTFYTPTLADKWSRCEPCTAREKAYKARLHRSIDAKKRAERGK